MRNSVEEIVARETVAGIEVVLYAVDTGMWMGQRDTFHRAEFDGQPVAIGQAGEDGYEPAIARAREVAESLASVA